MLVLVFLIAKIARRSPKKPAVTPSPRHTFLCSSRIVAPFNMSLSAGSRGVKQSMGWLRRENTVTRQPVLSCVGTMDKGYMMVCVSSGDVKDTRAAGAKLACSAAWIGLFRQHGRGVWGAHFRPGRSRTSPRIGWEKKYSSIERT